MYEGFIKEELTEAYKLLTNGKPALICTKGENEGQYNVTPYGWWTTVDYEPVTKVLFVSDPTHQGAINAKRTKQFALCVPLDEKDPVINQCGSVSDSKADKFKMFNIKGIKASKVDAMLLPDNSMAMIEFEVVNVIAEGSVEIIIGQSVAAWKRT